MQDLVSNAFKIIREIQENSRNALKELKAIKKTFEKNDFTKLGVLIESSRFENALKALNLEQIHTEFKDVHQRYIAAMRLEFDKKFLSVCNELNLKDVTGDSMSEFRIRGILSVKINYPKSYAEIRTFARSKRIKSTDPTKIAHELKTEVTRLFERPFEPRAFLNSLFIAYQKLYTESKKTILLKDVHRIFWLEKQKDDFFESSEPRKMVLYPLDEFSVDLGRLMESRFQSLENGYVCRISLGSGGVNIYGKDGNFNSYKFIEFKRGGDNA